MKAPLTCSLLWVAFASVAAAQTYYYPQPIYPGDALISSAPYSSTGFVSAKVGRDTYRGSGAVAKDNRIIYSCAHLFYDSGQWATNVRFARAYSGKGRPSAKALAKVRGYYFLASYAPAMEFSNDFAVAYGNSPFGDPLEVLPAAEAVAGLTGSGSKMILGYPADLDYNWEPGFHFLHRTGPFATKFSQTSGSWYEAARVSTGGGNSGGPVLLSTGGSYKLAGILISGDDYGEFGGIYAMSSASESAADLALDYVDKGAPEKASLRKSILMKDGYSKYRKTALRFRGIPPFISRASIGLVIYGQNGEVDVSLRSPGGRVRQLVDSQDQATWANATNEDIDISQTFAPSDDANGSWTLSYRDVRLGTPALLYAASLTLYTK